MSGVLVRQQEGPDTFEVSVAVTGGQLVAPTSGGKVGPAAAASTAVLGVALNDAQPAGSAPTNPINTGWPSQYVAVVKDVDVRVTYNIAANFGDLLVSAANGQVSPVTAVSTPTPGDVTNTRAIIGRCTEPLGVTAGAVGRARIF